MRGNGTVADAGVALNKIQIIKQKLEGLWYRILSSGPLTSDARTQARIAAETHALCSEYFECPELVSVVEPNGRVVIQGVDGTELDRIIESKVGN